MDSTVPNYNANWEDHFESFEEDEQISYTETKRVFGQIPSKLQAIFDINTKNNIIIAILKERVGAFEEQQHLENFISSDRKAGLMCSETQHLNQETAKCSDLFTQYEDKIRRREEEERILRSNYAAISTVSVERMMMNDPVIRLALEDHVARLKQIISFTCDNYLVVLSKQFRRPIGCHHKVPDDILLERVKSAETKTAEEHYLPNTYKQYYSVRVIAFRGQDRPQETEQPADIKKD